jgi:hypothetical protein
MAQLIYLCDDCSKMVVLTKGALVSIPFNRLPNLVLEADNHKCNKKAAA